MNIALSVLNAAALVALVTFHFQDDGSQSQSVAIQPQPHHLLRQAPQLAIMAEPRHESAMVANESDASAQTTQSSPRWIF
ncbi:hypothetical protein [Pseudomonas syringae]|uniref:Uncharacterized protein n=1 Tax=Pseudomonas syringae TaxID=317 RepID=A0A085VHP5_PSESX|nr:hypothetical protein [Pseudomonas syringae]KFE54958.1 hypothetical protein IV02_02730 [Pseudomonas syringae]